MKKKGLIISTIAMVVVLVVALSTATFAWFSDTATVAVENLQITTGATSGLQIGVNTTAAYTAGDFANYTYGTPTLGVTGVFVAESGNKGKLGSKIDFSEVKKAGENSVDKAVTKADPSNAYKCIYTGESGNVAALKTFVGDPTLYDKLYTAEAGADPITQASTLLSANAYDLSENSTDTIEKDEAFYIVPNEGAYVGSSNLDSDEQPKDYNLVSPNIGNAALLELPLAVRPTMQVGAIFCTVTITYDVGTMANTDFAPGMLAATYIEIDDAFVWAPFGEYKATGGEMTKPEEGGDHDAIHKDSVAYSLANGYMSQEYTPKDSASEVLRYVVAIPGDGPTDVLDANDKPFQNVFRVWIEGKDGECIADTAGSGFTLDFSYKHETGAATINNGGNYDYIEFGDDDEQYLVDYRLTHKGDYKTRYPKPVED